MNNLQLNDGLLSDFYDATFRRRDEIKPLFSKYESMINNLIKFQYFTSLYQRPGEFFGLSDDFDTFIQRHDTQVRVPPSPI